MNNFEVDVEALDRVERELGEYRHQLMRHLNAAHDLIDSVPRSTAPKPDPVANKLHEVYRGRADSETGVRGLLEDYIAELDDMIALIHGTASAYRAGDQNAVDRIRKAYGEAL